MTKLTVINKRGKRVFNNVKEFNIEHGNILLELDDGNFAGFGNGTWYEFDVEKND